jgi:putative MATE family efflux protein
VAQAYTHLVVGGRSGLDMGMQAMIARAVGAHRVDLANHVALQGFTLTFLFSLAMVVIGLLFTDPLMRVLGVSDTVIGQTSLYMRIQFVGAAAMSFRMSTASALQASGDVITPMKATVLARLVHLVLSPFLIFGWWGLPSMGIAGAAVANVLAQTLAVFWNLYTLFSGGSRQPLPLRGYSVDLPLRWRLLKIGGPASVTMVERTTSQLVLIRLVTPFGDAALAAFSLTRRLEHLASLGSMGLGRASGTLVGQNLGAGQPERAETTLRWALGYVVAIGGCLALLLIAFPAFFLSPFSTDKEFLDVATLWLRIQAVGALFTGGGMVFQQSFNVAGDTLAPMLVTLFSQWAVEIPVAFGLSRFTALVHYGIPLATAGAMALRLALYTGYSLTGRWLRVKVL